MPEEFNDNGDNSDVRFLQGIFYYSDGSEFGFEFVQTNTLIGQQCRRTAYIPKDVVSVKFYQEGAFGKGAYSKFRDLMICYDTDGHSPGTSIAESYNYVPYKKTSIPIPPAVQNLPGYGWSAGTAKNWVDWENKKYHQEVGRAIYNGSSNVRHLDTTTTHINYIIYISQLFSGGVLLRKSTWDCHFINNRFVHKKNGFNNVWQADWTNADSEAFSISMPTSYETSEQVKEFFASNPLELYYELATPIVTDISNILPADNLIEVEAGGTLTFKNQHGDDYRISVPSEVEYMINVEEAL